MAPSVLASPRARCVLVRASRIGVWQLRKFLGTGRVAGARVPGYEGSQIIDAPIDIVRSVLVDVERMPEWTQSMQSVQLLEGPVIAWTSRLDDACRTATIKDLDSCQQDGGL
jgi:hypothetical protein